MGVAYRDISVCGFGLVVVSILFVEDFQFGSWLLQVLISGMAPATAHTVLPNLPAIGGNNFWEQRPPCDCGHL